MDRPPVSGEPRTLSADEAREHVLKFLPEDWNADVIGNFKWRLDQYRRAIEAEASTGAALDVLRDLFVAMQAEPVVHGTDRFHHDRWMRWSRDTFMPAWNAAAECIARIAEQEGDR